MPNDNKTNIVDSAFKDHRASRKIRTDFFSGMLSGTVCAVIFHPIDRAIYLSIKHNRNVFNQLNFQAPFHAVMQTMVQRAFLGSAYYIAQEQMKNFAVPYLRDELKASKATQDVTTGFVAGSVHAIMTNPVALIKAHAWSSSKHTFKSSAKEIYQSAGYSGFMKGISASLGRDTIYGCTYEVMRSKLRQQSKKLQHHHSMELNDKVDGFVCNSTAALFSTSLSSPFNHARTKKFATSPSLQAPSILSTWKQIWTESNAHSHKLFGRASYIPDRLRIGAGTIRSSLGMALGQGIFDTLKTQFDTMSDEDPVFTKKKIN